MHTLIGQPLCLDGSMETCFDWLVHLENTLYECVSRKSVSIKK